MALKSIYGLFRFDKHLSRNRTDLKNPTNDLVEKKSLPKGQSRGKALAYLDGPWRQSLSSQWSLVGCFNEFYDWHMPPAPNSFFAFSPDSDIREFLHNRYQIQFLFHSFWGKLFGKIFFIKNNNAFFPLCCRSFLVVFFF